jgi:hypothetical protein
MATGEAHVRITADVSKFEAALSRAAEAASKAVWGFRRLHERLARDPRHRARCAVCSPMANPRPLTIDGHAYHRKTRARRKRRNR